MNELTRRLKKNRTDKFGDRGLEYENTNLRRLKGKSSIGGRSVPNRSDDGGRESVRRISVKWGVNEEYWQ